MAQNRRWPSQRGAQDLYLMGRERKVLFLKKKSCAHAAPGSREAFRPMWKVSPRTRLSLKEGTVTMHWCRHRARALIKTVQKLLYLWIFLVHEQYCPSTIQTTLLLWLLPFLEQKRLFILPKLDYGDYSGMLNHSKGETKKQKKRTMAIGTLGLTTLCGSFSRGNTVNTTILQIKTHPHQEVSW